MKKWIFLLIGLALLIQTVCCFGEEIPEIEIIERRPASDPAAAVSKPELFIEGVADRQYGVSLVEGDIIIISWHAEGDVQRYHVSITDEDDQEIDAYDTTAETGIVKAETLVEGEAYTVTVTAIPGGGLSDRDGVSAVMRFARYIPSEEASAPEDMPETAPEATPEAAPEAAPEDMPEAEAEFTAEAAVGPGEISDSWEQIIAAITYGTARQRYQVGDTKELDLGELGVIHMQLAGFGLDERSGGGKAVTTWIALELLPEGHVMDENGSTEGGWRDSDLRAYLNEVVYGAVPQAVRERLICVKKRQYDLGEQAENETDEWIWIPDRNELSGEDALYNELFGDSDLSRVKQNQEGASAWWWLRSAYTEYAFYAVNSNGGISYTGAGARGGVVVGFCL